MRQEMAAGMPLLQVDGLCASHGRAQILHDVSLAIAPGTLVALIGANGAGKTTLLRSLSGLMPRSGRIAFAGTRIEALGAARIASLGLLQVPENRRVFVDQSVEDNLLLGAYMRLRAEGIAAIRRDMGELFERFPQIGERRDSLAGLLSGGEQQILAIARALIGKPRLLMLDEPSLGLAPRIVDQIFDLLAAERDRGLTILLVEQLALQALSIADRGYVLSHGRIAMQGEAASLISDAGVRDAYLGGGSDVIG